MTTPRKTKHVSGGAALRESGRVPILVPVTPEERELIRQAAAMEKRPMGGFLGVVGLREARKIVERNLGGDGKKT